MSLRLNLVAGVGAAVWNAAIAIAVLPLYLRYLGPDGWGAVGFFMTVQGWLSVVDAGLSPAFNREFARLRAGLAKGSDGNAANVLRSAEWMYLAGGAIVASGLAASSEWIADAWLRTESLPPVAVSSALQWLGVAIALQWLGSLYRQVLLGLQKQVVPSLLGVLASTARALVTVGALAWIAPTLQVFVAVQLGAAALEALGLRSYLSRSAPELANGRWSAAALHPLRSFVGGVAVLSLLSTLLTQGDKLLLSALLPLSEFGLLMLAATVAGALGLASSPVYLLAYPRLSALTGRGDERAFATEYARWSAWMAVLVLPPASVLAFFAEDVLSLWTGNPQIAAQAAPLLALWTLGAALNALLHVPHAAQLASGWTRLSTTLNGLVLVCLVPLTLWLVPSRGAQAAGWIWVGVNLLHVFLGVSLMHRRILAGQARQWYVHSLLVPAAAAATPVAAAAYLLRLTGTLTGFGLVACVVLLLAASAACTMASAPAARLAVASWIRRLG